ncbi:TIGR03915 family putative DNA repair protein [Longimicrobium sp.]|uniref:TIGR03915 family putative DNA repair protein n=1 Tax=Longimicrobium sp. TaxID=2029185 RepID=UPI002E36C2E8|nr:TIGR03915 family putative DNA repair protein [Longimicrobium sp.]HEX6037610.1 TIGR03915 family putative DNA repair protein [Longimicrobium sp.]
MIEVAIEPTFAAWRAAARRLLLDGVEPRDVAWRDADDAQQGLGLALAADAAGLARPQDAFRVSKRFVELAQAAACHADPERWGLLYRLLWRQTHGEPRLMDVASDPDVHRLLRMEKAVRRDTHKMKAFVRFRTVEHEGETIYVAWFEPDHHIVERASEFFKERFASMRWSILTPRRCVHWDGESLAFTPGVSRADAPTADVLETLWRTYYASTFNPARLRTRAMRAEMPQRYWKNLPEADLITPLVADAPARTRRMIEQQARDELARRERKQRRTREGDADPPAAVPSNDPPAEQGE